MNLEQAGRILLLMTTRTYRSRAFLQAAERLGSPVVVGTDQALALSSANPGGHLQLDFQEPEKSCRAILEFAEEHPLHAVVPAEDEGALLAAMASEALGLPYSSVEAVSAARDKHRMRDLLAQAGIPSPRFALFPIQEDPEEAVEHVGFPCVLKPTFLSASRGVIRADDPAEFVAAFRRLGALLHRPEIAAQGGDQAGWILVEDFIPGFEVAVEGILSKGKLKVLALFDKPDPLDGPFFEETLYVTPSRLPAEAQAAIVASTARALMALGLTHGPVHAELRHNGQGPWVIEIAPRSIGGLCSRTLRFGEGISLEELILRHALGLEVDSCERETRAAGVMMIPIPEAGVLREVHGQEAARAVPGIEAIKLTIPPGREVVPLPEGSEYLGFIFARHETPEFVEAALREAHRQLTFRIAPRSESTQTEAHPRVRLGA